MRADPAHARAAGLVLLVSTYMAVRSARAGLAQHTKIIVEENVAFEKPYRSSYVTAQLAFASIAFP
jgi:hypothetical protein